LLWPPLFFKVSQKNKAIFFEKALVIFLLTTGKDCHPRTSFCARTMTQSTPPPQPRTSKGGKGVKKVHYPLYPPDIAPAKVLRSQNYLFRLLLQLSESFSSGSNYSFVTVCTVSILKSGFFMFFL
jgi:hypothetical protein